MLGLFRAEDPVTIKLGALKKEYGMSLHVLYIQKCTNIHTHIYLVIYVHVYTGIARPKKESERERQTKA